MLTIYTCDSEYQHGEQEIHVLLPDDYQPNRSYRVLYVLPVEVGFEQQYGYGLGVIQQMDAHNRCGLICVQPGFEIEPWFGDHPNNPRVRQASYLRKFVVPWVERHFSTPGTSDGRMLFGFSKSGWGAFSLILANPEYFGWAAAWDAPMLLDQLRFKMAAVFDTQENLNRFRPDLLVALPKKVFGSKPRLALAGECAWGKHTAGLHALLEREKVAHVYRDDLFAPHRWDPAWMEPLLEMLVALPGSANVRN
jgi:enterochelin esterase-like enzyme